MIAPAKKCLVTNVTFSVGECSTKGPLACDFGGARYHVWIDAESGERDPTLYKNPPPDVKQRDKGYFRTRLLNPDSAHNAAIIAAMLEAYERDGLKAKAFALRAEHDATEKARREAAAAIYWQEQAGPDLFAALSEALAVLEAINTVKPFGDRGHKAIKQASVALAKAKGGAA